MPKITILVFIICVFLSGCRPDRQVNPSFYYWKTVYKQDSAENKYLQRLGAKALYVRIMDVDIDPESRLPVPVSPIMFSQQLPADLTLIPVVYIVNNVFKDISAGQIRSLANRVALYVNEKVRQGTNGGYGQLQVDCDWTATTRDNYFNFIMQLKQQKLLAGKLISVTLRMHQIKNQLSSGIPPVTTAMLMCYNMGNLRKYGATNSILNMGDIYAYLKDNLRNYPLKLDVALPLFKWAVVFRGKEYAGISKRISLPQLQNKTLFTYNTVDNLYTLQHDLPAAGLKKGDEIRWEEISSKVLYETSGFLSRYLAGGDLNLTFYHLDKPLLEDHPYEDLEKIINQL